MDYFEVGLYILSMANQIAGALLLMLFAISTNRKKVIRSFASSHIIGKNDTDHGISYNRDAFISMYETRYYARSSVIFIVLGYFFSVFGSVDSADKMVIVIMIAMVSILLIVLSMIIVYYCLNNESVRKEITYEELKEAGCEADIIITNPSVEGETLICGGVSMPNKNKEIQNEQKE